MLLAPTVIFFLIAGFSIAGNIAVLYHAFQHSFQSFKAITTKLIIMLHISTLLQNICTLPDIYAEDATVCAIMGFAHYYTGLINVIIIIFTTITYYFFLFESVQGRKITEWINHYGIPFAFGFSFITVLPYSTNSYGQADVWCTLTIDDNMANVWSFVIFYLWVMFAIVICSFVTLYIVYYSAKHDAALSRRLFTSIGIYIIISVICFLPRVIPRLIELFTEFDVTDTVQFVTGIPMYIAGIAYCVCYYKNSNTLRSYENDTTSVDRSHSNQSIHVSELSEIFHSETISNPRNTDPADASITGRMTDEKFRANSNNVPSMVAAEMRFMPTMSPMMKQRDDDDEEV